MSEQELKIKVVLDDKDAQKKLKALDKATESLEKQTVSSTKKMSTGFKTMNDNLSTGSMSKWSTSLQRELTTINKALTNMNNIAKSIPAVSVSANATASSAGGQGGGNDLAAEFGGEFLASSINMEGVKTSIEGMVGASKSSLKELREELAAIDAQANMMGDDPANIMTWEGDGGLRTLQDDIDRTISKMPPLQQAIERVKRALKELSKTSPTFAKINEGISGFKTKIKTATREVSKFKKELNSKLGAAFQKVANAAKIAGVAMLGAMTLGLQDVKALNGAWQTLNNIVGKDGVKAVDEWAKAVGAGLGITRTEAASTAAFLAPIMESIFAPEDVTKATTQLIGQMGIMSSKLGKPMEQIQEAIQSGFMGSFETIENIIPTINRDLADTYAMAMFGVSAFSQLGAAQQKAAMYQMVVAQSAKLYGNELDAQTTAMNNMSVRLAELKREFGLLAAALLEAFGPAIDFVINMLYKLVGVIQGIVRAWNNVFSGGSTKKAKNDVDALTNSFGAASGAAGGIGDSLNGAATAAKKLKNLMGFDELQVVGNPDAGGSSSAGGGAGGTGGGSFTGAIPDLEIPKLEGFDQIGETAQNVQEKLEPLFKFIREYKEPIIAVALAIGIMAIGFSALSAIKDLSVVMSFFGLSWGIIGAAFLLISGALLYIQGIMMLFDKDQPVGKALAYVAIAIGAITVAVLLLFGWIPALITAIVLVIGVLIALIVRYWEEIVKFFKDLWEDIVEFFKGLWEDIKEIFRKVKDWFKEKFEQAWEAIKEAWENVGEFFSGIWEKITEIFGKVKNWFKDKFEQAWEAIKDVFAPVGEFFSRIWDNIKEKFTKIGSSIGGAIGDAFAVVVNSIIGFAEKTINGFIKAINLAIGVINKIPGVEITKLSLLEIPRLAQGGVLNSARTVIAGEDGAEAIVPLERNTEWIDMLAAKINGGGSKQNVSMTVDNRTFAECVIGALNDYTAETGNLPLRLN